SGETGQMCLVEGVTQRVERARLAALDECPDREGHHREGEVAVDLTLAPVIERADESIANDARLTGARVVGPRIVGARQPDASWLVVCSAQTTAHVCESSTLGIDDEHRPAGAHGGVHQTGERGGLA